MSKEQKKKWHVALPISGVIYIEIEAEDEESAIDAALEQSFNTKDIAEWETHRDLVRGNVCYANTTRASAEEI